MLHNVAQNDTFPCSAHDKDMDLHAKSHLTLTMSVLNLNYLFIQSSLTTLWESISRQTIYLLSVISRKTTIYRTYMAIMKYITVSRDTISTTSPYSLSQILMAGTVIFLKIWGQTPGGPSHKLCRFLRDLNRVKIAFWDFIHYFSNHRISFCTRSIMLWSHF